MRLAAIYIRYHEYAFKQPKCMNLGTQYIYNFKEEDEKIKISRIENKNYIKDFFVITPDIRSKITNLTTIVGQNGAGKTTILDIIRSAFVKHIYAFPNCEFLLLFEDESGGLSVINNCSIKTVLFENKTNKYVVIKEQLKEMAQTIYYSPHYDYRYNYNFDNIDNHDISFDKIVEMDLEELSDKETTESGFPYKPTQELLFKNSIRQIEFLSSDLVSKQKIFNEIFQLPEHNDMQLVIRGYYIETDKEWNTPTSFRSVLKTIQDKIKSEADAWTNVRQFDKTHNVINQVDINKYLIKRNILSAIVSLLYRQMEKTNQFLEEGKFPYGECKSELENLDAYGALLLFLEKSRIFDEPLMNHVCLKKLVDKLYKAIDSIIDERQVSNTKFKTCKESAIGILKLQREFISELNQYHVKFYSNKEDLEPKEYEKIDDFVNYQPFEKHLSSGEHALLNLFSRLYWFLNTNIKKGRFRKPYKHYILLIDEGDLAFHPNWKKKYVKSLLGTLPHFFNELDHKPSFEIIFTTHDPLTLSDIPNSNVVYVTKTNDVDGVEIFRIEDNNRPSKTFGANISTLLADSFFTENSLIGDFAFDKIQEAIKWLNNKSDKKDHKYYKKVIQIIDEPIIQRKLAEMYDDKMKESFQLGIINEQIRVLEKLKENIS